VFRREELIQLRRREDPVTANKGVRLIGSHQLRPAPAAVAAPSSPTNKFSVTLENAGEKLSRCIRVVKDLGNNPLLTSASKPKIDALTFKIDD
jgi:hypothetical protein